MVTIGDLKAPWCTSYVEHSCSSLSIVGAHGSRVRMYQEHKLLVIHSESVHLRLRTQLTKGPYATAIFL